MQSVRIVFKFIIKLICSLLIVIVLNSCNQGQKQKRILTTYYQDGKIKRTRMVVSKTLNGPLVDYYENGRIKDSVSYINNLENGWFEEYYENGVKKAECYFYNGKILGPNISYYQNGIIKDYRFYDEGSEAIVDREYDENGGHDEPPFYVLNDTNNIKKGDTLKCEIYLFRPPDFHVDSLIAKIGLAEKFSPHNPNTWDEEGWSKIPINDKDFKYVFNKVLPNRGTYELQIGISATFKKSGKQDLVNGYEQITVK